MHPSLYPSTFKGKLINLQGSIRDFGVRFSELLLNKVSFVSRYSSRRIWISSPVQSTSVEETPPCDLLRRESLAMLAAECVRTSSAVVGLGWLEMLAEVTAMGTASLQQGTGQLMIGHANADSGSGRDHRGQRQDFFGTRTVSGPGQKRAISLAAGIGISSATWFRSTASPIRTGIAFSTGRSLAA